MSNEKSSELESHINFFLNSLPANLGLERVMNLDFSNPAAALSTLLEVRSNLETERKKAQALKSLHRVTTPLVPAFPQ